MDLILQRAWQKRGLLAWLLGPLGAFYFTITCLRRVFYRKAWLPVHHLQLPVIVVGNITVGGSGKTPLCLWLAELLIASGRRPGIVCRGYLGKFNGVREVAPNDTALFVGDEPLLLRRRSGCPVYVGKDRVAAAKALIADHPECDVIIADDGLQHYRMGRAMEIAVLDSRGLGNGWFLPAGPLREPVQRLDKVDAVVLNGLEDPPWPARRHYHMRLGGTSFIRLDAAGEESGVEGLAGLRLHACAGIGAPQRFFDTLSALGLSYVAHAFPDHHRYAPADLLFPDCDALLMTEKDAIKCSGIAPCPVWVLPVTATLEAGLAELILEKIDGHPLARNSGLSRLQGATRLS